ncbi:hypothetical protein HPULCUR_000122 [Helicostylum pulchrum]|uniref:Disease resistance R13L4/SHOC-2-like LRR domain-containing protein n=1 Tax=Helicostylum pulchrum TaxID=562976 RepID=A0ABP9XIZ7_9FUNG
MGQQQSSKSQAPLTFGYINHKPDTITIDEYDTGRDNSSNTDFVLDNPHLYKLEFTCRHCKPGSLIVAEQSKATCTICKKNKRLSLVRQNLANDLNYIDQTYYPNIVHYEEEEESESEMQESDDYEQEQDNNDDYDDDDDTDTLRDEEGWSKLTVAEVSPSPKRLVSSPLVSVDLSGKSLIKLSSSIGYLNNLTKLDLSDNQMINLPKALGQLTNLRIFNASKNQLESIPDTITGLVRLKAINLSNNKLRNLPKGIGSLPSLIILILNQNQLTELPREISQLNDLITLNVSNNPLKSIPAEIATLKSLRKFTAEDCAFETEFVYSLKHNPPSLFETCARKISSSKIPLPSSLANHPIADYFRNEQTCSFCYGPFFDSFVVRGKFIERTNRQLIALDYKLCCAHWSDEQDRISAMFSTPCVRLPSQNIIVDDILLTPSEEELLPQLPPSDYFDTDTTTTTNDLNTSIPSASSSSSSFVHRPRSSTSSSSLLRIHTMQQQLHHHLSTSFLRHSTLAQENLGAADQSILPFTQLQGQQADHVDRILHTSSPLSQHASSSASSNSSSSKKSNGRAIKDGFAQLGQRLGRRNRDRSETV